MHRFPQEVLVWREGYSFFRDCLAREDKSLNTLRATRSERVTVASASLIEPGARSFRNSFRVAPQRTRSKVPTSPVVKSRKMAVSPLLEVISNRAIFL